MLAFLGYIAQLIINPRRGWEDVETEAPQPRRLLLSGLFPLIILTALSCYIRVFYENDCTLVDATNRAIITAVAYFATYYIATFAISLRYSSMAQEESDLTTDRETECIETFSACIVGLLLLITLMSNLIPLDISLLQYLPLYSVYVIWKGEDFLRIDPRHTGHFMILAVLSLIVPVYAIAYFYNLFT